MSLRRCAIIAWALAGLASGEASAREGLSNYSVGPWRISTHSTSAGELASCVAKIAADPVGYFMLMKTIRGVWVVGIEHRGAPWRLSQSSRIEWSVGGESGSATERAYDGILISRLGGGDDRLRRVRRASEASVTIDGVSYRADLVGIDAAAGEVERCIATRGTVNAPAVASRVVPGRPAGYDTVGEVRGWTVDAYYEKDGKIVSCVANRTTKDNIVVGLRLTAAGNWSILALLDGETRERGAIFRFLYRIDELPVRGAYGQMATEKVMSLDISDSPDLLQELRSGNVLRVRVEKQEYEFSLGGSAAAMTAVERCVGRAAPSRPAPPPRSAPAPAPAAPAAPSLPTETPSSQR